MTAAKSIFNALILGLALTLAACGGKQSKENTEAANNEIDRMNAIQSELKSDGILINSLTLSRATIGGMTQGELKATDTLLTEYINRGANALAATEKDGVVYSEADKNHMRTLIQSAKTIRNEVRNRMTDAPEDDDGGGQAFWKSYHACYDLYDRTKWISNGIDAALWKQSRDASKYSRLSSTKKRAFKNDVTEFKRCIAVIIDGRRLLGHTSEVNKLLPRQEKIAAALAYAKSH